MTCNEMAFFPSNFMLQTHDQQDHHQPSSTSLNQIISSCTPQDFHGVTSFLGKRSLSFSRIEGCTEEMINNGDDDLSDDCSQLGGEKKRRLNMEQVKTLEKNFELGNKLEPERKIQLARALGLQPRQIAIWFQNRRARWKTKQLEKDYDLLKKQFESIKADNDFLQSQNNKLQAEIMALKGRETTEPIINLNKETEGSSSNRSENSSDMINFDISRTSAIDSPPLPTHPIANRPLFPPSLLRPTSTAAAATHLIQNSTRSEHQCPKIEHPVQEESFSNLFIGMDDQSGSLWPWPDQHHNFH